MAVSLADRQRVSKGLKSWLDDLAAYEREFKKWEHRGEKLLKRYRDEQGAQDGIRGTSHFNIFWSNVQTLCAATYSRIPKPDVSRRFRDNDPVGRVASLILERGLDFHIQHYSEYRSALKAVVLDRFIGGRGTVWVRYEPHFKQSEQPSGVEITEDVENPSEELDYECVAVDYVHWKDFGHSVARTWEEVPRVWRKVYMTKSALETRFGKEKAALIPLDASAKDQTNSEQYRPGDAVDRATVFEGWDKEEKKAVWFCRGVKDFLDERADPLGLEDFFPCPKPIYSTLTNDSLVPVPDFVIYQDQANELDLLSDRIEGLVRSLQVKGVYNASLGVTISRLFTEGENGTLLPVKEWAAFAEKNGLKGSIDLVDILPIAQALEQAYKAHDRIKEQIYEITGISDIVRGQSEASETATAQQIKGQYASLRLKTYQEQIARFASEVLQIMAQVMCKKFDPQTLLSVAAADQLSQTDQQMIQPALEILVGPQRLMDPSMEEGPNPMRQFRVEVEADTLVYLDENSEKQDRMEFLTAVGGFLEKAVPAAQVAPQMIPLLMELLKYGVTGFRVGKNIEGTIDEAIEQLKQAAMNPPPPQPDPALEVAKVKAQGEAVKAQAAAQVAPIRAQAEMAKAHADVVGSQASVVVASEKARQARVQAAFPPGAMQ